MNWQNAPVMVGWSLRGGADALSGVAELGIIKKDPYPSTKTFLLIPKLKGSKNEFDS